VARFFKRIKNLINLFIVVWNSISLRHQYNRRLSRELDNETNYMIRLIKELTSLKALSNERKVNIIKALVDYRECRLSEKKLLRNTLSNDAWIE
jgi:hypothetical protein